MERIKKIHHITAIVGDPNENLKFYRLEAKNTRDFNRGMNWLRSGIKF